MTIPSSLLSLPLSSPIPGPTKKKRVLLVDASSATRGIRAEAMRKLGMEVDCACDITEARSWWRADLYNLVLINLEDKAGLRDRFCDEVRAAKPSQHVAFLVGKPGYLADLPNSSEDSIAAGGDSAAAISGEAEAVPQTAEAAAGPRQDWGIMEASRRISAVRSVWVARSNAMRNRPTPPRDSESRYSRRPQVEDPLQPLQKEEMP